MFAEPGYFGKLGQSLASAGASVVSYLLQASLTGANQAIANTETLGPTGSGATYEGYTDAGILTVKDGGDGSVAISSNKVRVTAQSGAGGYLTYVQGAAFTPVAGSALKATYTPVTVGNFAFMAGVVNASLPTDWDATALYRIASNSGDNQNNFNVFNGAGSVLFNYTNIGNYANDETDIVFVVGGFDATGAPDPTGTYGVRAFKKNITASETEWTLLAVGGQSKDFGIVSYPIFASYNLAGVIDYDDILLPDSSTTVESVFTPTGYALDTSIALSDTFTHVADHFISIKITTLPSSGSIDIGIRDDLAIRVSSAGAVTLVKAYATTPVTLITSGGTAANGSTIQLRQSGSAHELWVNGANKGTATDAANQTGTGGDIHSLGTGGAVSYVYSLPLVADTYDTALESF